MHLKRTDTLLFFSGLFCKHQVSWSCRSHLTEFLVLIIERGVLKSLAIIIDLTFFFFSLSLQLSVFVLGVLNAVSRGIHV